MAIWLYAAVQHARDAPQPAIQKDICFA